ncbi:ArsR/SmtB family transcription factor [Yanshouia hominis]|uniref:ArsR/SmtB family transcription factor n=1 Tax=Yanshouia hominis TaxID=2763673 RepID=UPI0034DB1747
MLNEMDAAAICKALGDSNRLQIMKRLSTGEICACKLLEQFRITQPTLSHHMKVLCECGLVTARKEGKWSHYSLNRKTLCSFGKFVASLSCCGEEGGDL